MHSVCVYARSRRKQEDDGISGAYKFDVSWHRVKEDATWLAIAESN